MLLCLEKQDYAPPLDQLIWLANTFQFDVADVFKDYSPPVVHHVVSKNITFYGAGYLGLSTVILNLFFVLILQPLRKSELLAGSAIHVLSFRPFGFSGKKGNHITIFRSIMPVAAIHYMTARSGIKLVCQQPKHSSPEL